MKLLAAVAAALAVVFTAGCGGDSSEGSTAAGGLDVVGVSQCLGQSGFLIQPSQAGVEGKTEAGSSFSISFYKDEAAAQQAFDSQDAATASLVENAVVEATDGSAKLSDDELATVKTCIDDNRS
jgi:hypothetical protein